MLLGEVDSPAELIEAHRIGTLVIFVGAGASRDEPSCLPDFASLTTEIAAKVHEPVSDEDLEHPDVFLGRIADHDVDVHGLVADSIGVPTSRPNRLHHALAALAVAGGPVRIVTTNYDQHLSAALRERGEAFEEYLAPALPVGNDFEGVVHLHGSLRQEPRRLVVTDRDFGRAYLQDAWAARFLERMFDTYTVLFIGYSHGDVVMRYLARALGRSDGRYALTHKPEEPDWRSLGLHPVAYPAESRDHTALVDAVERWAQTASMGLLDHRQQIARLVSAAPPQEPEDVEYLEAVLADSDQVRLFAELARGKEWLSWASTRPEFRAMFDTDVAPTACTRTLAGWFAEQFVVQEALSASALGIVHDAGGTIARALWSAIGHQLHVKVAPRPAWLDPWLMLLVHNDPGGLDDWLEYALLHSRWPQDRATALLLFDHLTEPHVKTRPAFGQPGSPQFEISLRGDGHHLAQAWAELFVPSLAETAQAVLAIADRHLRRAFHLLAVAGSARAEWDPTSFGRSAIEPHPQDRHPDPIDTLIDAARDSLEAILREGDDRAQAYVNTWANSDVPLLRRLAVHAWTCRTEVDGNAKLSWLRERGRLYDTQLHHEVFRLIAEALPSASGEVAQALLADVLAGPDEENAENRAYAQLNALSWIAGAAPDLQAARQAFEEVRAQYPHLAASEHPDFLHWSSSGTVGHQPPMTADLLHAQIGADAAEAIRELRGFESARSPFDGPTWNDALTVLSETVRDHPDDGFVVLDALDDDGHADIVRSVIAGWSTAPVSSDTADAILRRLCDVDLATVAGEVSRLLADGGRSENNPTEWHRFPAARQLAVNAWSALGTKSVPDGVTDWLHRAINDPAGRLAQFWTHVIAADWRAAGDQWTGLAPDTRAQLEGMLAGDDENTALAQVIVASQALFVFRADRQWCEAHVLPLFDWASPERARRAWDGHLIWGRWNDQLLQASMLDGYLATVHHRHELRDELRGQLLAHLAGVAATSDLDPLPWLRTFTVTADSTERAEWMNQVMWLLDDLPAEAVEHQWHRWMQPYWQDRLRSIPRQLTVEEASAMAAWVVYLTDSIGDGVKLATTQPASLNEHADILRKLKGDRLQRAPVEFGKLIAHLLRNTQLPFWGCHALASLVPELRASAEAADVSVIIEHAVRLNCHDAAQW